MGYDKSSLDGTVNNNLIKKWARSCARIKQMIINRLLLILNQIKLNQIKLLFLVRLYNVDVHIISLLEPLMHMPFDICNAKTLRTELSFKGDWWRNEGCMRSSRDPIVQIPSQATADSTKGLVLQLRKKKWSMLSFQTHWRSSILDVAFNFDQCYWFNNKMIEDVCLSTRGRMENRFAL